VHGARQRFQPGLAPPEDGEETALWFLFRGRELLVTLEGAVPAAADAGAALVRRQFLGLLGTRPCWCG